MKLKLLILILLSGYSWCYGQGPAVWNRIQFRQIIDGAFTKAELYFNNQESFYFFGNKPLEDTNSISIRIALTDSIGTVIYRNLSDPRVMIRESNGTEVVRIEDAVPPLQWELTDETKNRGEFLLRKATTTFRGRNYTAWYCEQLPFNYGPWKMNQLPGLILELYTDDNFLSVHFEKIQLQSLQNLPVSAILRHDRSVTIKDWAAESHAKVKELIEKIQTKMPRGVIIESKIHEPLERKFEWEH